MVTQDEILSQDDVDALLAGADPDGEEPGNQAPAAATAAAEPDRRMVSGGVKRSESEARGILASLCRRAFVPRDEGVRIIWNACDLFPLTPGYNMEIQGRKYVSLGPFGNEHLVVGRAE